MLLICILSQCQTNNQNFDDRDHFDVLDLKQKGGHVFGRLDSLNLLQFKKTNYEWITLVPFADQKDYNSDHLRHNFGDRNQMLRRDSMWKSQIDIAHRSGFKVFLKPHIWISSASDEKWRSDLFPSNHKNWISWKKDYRDFILRYARIAQESQVELFCVGTELTRLSIEKPDFWKELITSCKKIYSGKITYAANWYNEYEKITFWDQLDYIGVQAYFPLTKSKNPSVKEISEGWKKHSSSLTSISKKYNRKILFTELGYKSTIDSAIEPWKWLDYSSDPEQSPSYQTQANCYQAFFDSIWNKKWFAGVHIWQLRSDYFKQEKFNNLDFTPQGKPAEKIITREFLSNSN